MMKVDQLEPQDHDSMLGLIALAIGVHLIPAVKKIIKLLVDAGVAYYVQVSPDLVGIHPKNREGYMLNAHEVLKLLTHIFALGWDPEVPDPVCTDIPQSRVEEWQDKNAKVIEVKVKRVFWKGRV